ncbi:MAG: GEVED domain-containing protein [Crocinitomicaceae bacterium]|jgi:hypothetical protein|nr:GEVED domain-containing protein [Crocinitomicaceae bacterium]
MKKCYHGFSLGRTLRYPLYLLLAIIWSLNANAQCLNTTPYGNATVGATNGSSATIGCQFASEYGTWNGIQASFAYTTTSTNPTDYITVRSGTSNGPVVAHGSGPLSWISTAAGTYYIHITVDAACNTSSGCRDITTTNNGSATPCTDPATAGAAVSSVPNACDGQSFSLSLNGATMASGLMYQWQSSPDNVNYTPIVGATASTYSTTQTTATYYRCEVKCGILGTPSNSTEVLVGQNTFLDCYCTSTATSTADEEILGVSLGTLSNTSTCSTTGGPGSTLNRYSDYTSTVPAPPLARTVAYTMTIDVGTCGGNYTNVTGAWIDWNQNGLFTDPGEDVLIGNPTVGPHQENFIVTVPVGAALGLTRMRVLVEETGSSANIDPCGTYTWGETEDYYVEVFDVPTCPQPTNLTVLSTTTNSADLDWTPGGSETAWQLQYGPTGFALGTGTIVNVTGTSDEVLGSLTPYSFFDVYVRAICGAGDTSFWSPKQKFNTYGLGAYMEMDMTCHPDGFIDISETGAANPLLSDGETGFSLPFPMYFQGTEVNQITIANNGVIEFNTISAQVSAFNSNTIATNAPAGLYPFWDDLEDAGGMVYFEELGVAPNRKFVVQWVKKHDLFTSGVAYNFEVILEEGTGKIYYQYANTVVGSTSYDNGNSATVGLAGINQDFPLSYNNQSFLTENSCVEFYYTNCPKPENLILQYVTPDEAAFSWSAGLFGESDWTVIYGPEGFDPATGGTTLTVNGSPTVTLVGLTQLTCYDIYVYAECSAGNQSFALIGNFCTLPLCANPTNFTGSTDIDSLFTNWSWSPYDPMYTITNYDLLYGTPGYDPANEGTYVMDDAFEGDTIYDQSLLAGGVYEMYVRGVCDTLVSSWVGPITVTMPLTNDSVCGAELLPVNGLHNVFNNSGSTTQANESTIAPPVTGAQETDGWLNNSLSKTTWFKFIAPSTGQIRINATDVSYNGQVAVYEIVTCNDFTTFNLVAANDDDIDGNSLAPNFTICGLTPGAEYYLMHDSYNTATGSYALRLSEIDLIPGVAGPITDICSKDTVNLFDGISGYQAGGVWNDLDGTFHIVNDSLFNTSGLAYQVYNFEYRLTDGCATEGVTAQYQVYAPSSAGTDGSLTICKNQPFSTVSALGGTINAGGQWYDAGNNPIAGPNVPFGTLNIPGNYNYRYIVGNGVCPDDTSIVTVSVDATCDALGIEEAFAQEFQLYPNPTTGAINVTFSALSETTTVEVLDAKGRLIQTKTIKAGGTFTSFDMEGVETGVYMIHLINTEFDTTKRFVKQ